MKRFIVAVGILIAMSSVAMAASYNTVSVTSAPVTTIISTSSARAGWVIHNVSTSTIYIGTDGQVSATTGLPVTSGEKLLLEGMYIWRKGVYAVAPAGSSAQEVRYLEWEMPQ